MKLVADLVACLICALFLVGPCFAGSQVETIYWEAQSWKPGGGSERLTVWDDGRSEIIVKRHGQNFHPKKGWQMKLQSPFSIFTKENALPAKIAKEKFQSALKAGIEDLKTFKVYYNDGSATKVGISSGGRLVETLIPMFHQPADKNAEPQSNEGSENFKRFQALKKILGEFDTDAFEQLNP